MKRVLMIGTGGTIASEMTGAGLVPELTTDQFLKYVPAVRELCDVTCRQVCNIDSTNMSPAYWLEIARAIREAYSSFDGFVVCHGTDTMAYTAAALSYLVQQGPKPIVLTGSQKPINMDITDSKTNLLDSFVCACDGRIPGVQVVFGGAVILGTRARKTYSKSFGAFSSINYPVLGVVQDNCLVPYIRPQAQAEPVFYDALNSRVALLKLIPGASAGQLRFLLDENDAVILESFGVGGVPSGETGEFYEVIRKASAKGKTVVVTTQVQNEGSDLSIYNVGHSLKNSLGVLEAFDMTTEAVVAKLMWLLPLAVSPEDISMTPTRCRSSFIRLLQMISCAAQVFETARVRRCVRRRAGSANQKERREAALFCFITAWSIQNCLPGRRCAVPLCTADSRAWRSSDNREYHPCGTLR